MTFIHIVSFPVCVGCYICVVVLKGVGKYIFNFIQTSSTPCAKIITIPGSEIISVGMWPFSHWRTTTACLPFQDLHFVIFEKNDSMISQKKWNFCKAPTSSLWSSSQYCLIPLESCCMSHAEFGPNYRPDDAPHSIRSGVEEYRVVNNKLMEWISSVLFTSSLG